MSNIEYKVRCDDLDAIRQRAIVLGATRQWSRRHVDTYFNAANGRFKLRETDGKPGATLIAYSRPDEVFSRVSDYQLIEVDDPAAYRAMLGRTLGVRAMVVKQRELYLYGTTRIHLDMVDRLGTFVELETVLGEVSVYESEAEHEYVKAELALDRCDVVAVSYVDLQRG